MAAIGLVAGAGRLPEIFADIARSRGEKVIGIGLKGVSEDSLESHVDKFIWLDVGSIQKAIFAAMANRITKVVLLGKIDKRVLFKNTASLDNDTKKLIGSLSDRRDYSILNKVSEFIGKFGIQIIDPLDYLKVLVPEKGVITKRSPSNSELEDIGYGLGIVRELARLDIGQAIAIKDKTVIAIEAVEGTDKTISRAGELAPSGFVLVKAARPEQDMRFDVPLVGFDTVQSVINAGGTALAIESGKTFLIEREEILNFANAKDFSIIVV